MGEALTHSYRNISIPVRNWRGATDLPDLASRGAEYAVTTQLVLPVGPASTFATVFESPSMNIH